SDATALARLCGGNGWHAPFGALLLFCRERIYSCFVVVRMTRAQSRRENNFVFSSLPGLTRQSMPRPRVLSVTASVDSPHVRLDDRVKPVGDESPPPRFAGQGHETPALLHERAVKGSQAPYGPFRHPQRHD